MSEIEVHPRFYLAPVPGLRLWAYLVSRYGKNEVRTSPGELFETLRAEGLVISKRSLAAALDGLVSAGMLDLRRRGNAITMRLKRHA